jgi:molybdopterin synthase sulfur carrier subunit
LKVDVRFPPALRQYTGKKSEIELDATTVEEVLTKLDEFFPGLKDLLLDESSGLRRFVNIFVNDDDIRSGAGLATKLKDNDHIQIIPAIAGG